jgi:oxalate decarboxylase/phosphoglucose isomerase-like protein (cupin superfamily)
MKENWKDIKLDDPSSWPDEKMVELPKAHVDARGSIQPLVDLPMKNASLITSKRGTLRSNHFHRTDWHFMYVLEGSFEYYYRQSGTQDTPRVLHVGVGEMVFTPPMEDHATVFLEDCSMLVVSRNPRDQESYEADVERVQLLDPADYLGAE